MSGTAEGAAKTKAKNLASDPNYYSRIGSIGGKNSSNGGFASDVVGKDGLTGRERSRIAGRIGGKIVVRTENNHKLGGNNMSLKSTDEIVEEYHEKHNILYKIEAIDDDIGEVIAKVTSCISADDASMYSWEIDEAVRELALNDFYGAERNQEDDDAELEEPEE